MNDGPMGIIFDLVINSDINIFWNWLKNYLDSRFVWVLRGDFDVDKVHIHPIYSDPIDMEDVPNARVDFYLIDIDNAVEEMKNYFPQTSDEWDRLYEAEATHHPGKIEVVQSSNNRIEVIADSHQPYFDKNLGEIGSTILNACAVVSILYMREKEELLDGKKETMEGEKRINMDNNKEKYISKRGPKTLPDSVKIEALKEWDALDNHQITQQEWLENKFGKDEHGNPMILESTFRGWRKKFKE